MSTIKGWIGEKKTAFSLWLSLPKKTYHRFHNIIIPSKNGTTQIDHIVVCRYGIFIIETKNKTGWIFANEDQANWTQSFYAKKYSFQNPLRQTFRQKKILAEYLNVNESDIKTVVFFVGDAIFKTAVPHNVINSRLGKYIKQFKAEVLQADTVDMITAQLKMHMASSTLTTSDHIQSLKQRHNSTTRCPQCGSQLVTRRARQGVNAGSIFFRV